MRLEKLFAFLEESPGDPFLLFAVAKEYEKSGQQEEAAQYFQKLVDEHPDYVGTYYHFGKLLEDQVDPEEAIAIYDKGMEVARRHADQHALSELAGARLALDD